MWKKEKLPWKCIKMVKISKFFACGAYRYRRRNVFLLEFVNNAQKNRTDVFFSKIVNFNSSKNGEFSKIFARGAYVQILVSFDKKSTKIFIFSSKIPKFSQFWPSLTLSWIISSQNYLLGLFWTKIEAIDTKKLCHHRFFYS